MGKDSKHTMGETDKFIEPENIDIMRDWSAVSMDLSLPENGLDKQKKRFENCILQI